MAKLDEDRWHVCIEPGCFIISLQMKGGCCVMQGATWLVQQVRRTYVAWLADQETRVWEANDFVARQALQRQADKLARSE